MKKKTLLMVAGAGALVYLLWKKDKAENSDPYERERKRKAKCEYLGGTWLPIMCAVAPCVGGDCMAKDGSIIKV